MEHDKVVLLLSCPDRAGILATITSYVFENGGNILDMQQHTDEEDGYFLSRTVWSADGFRVPADQLADHVKHSLKIDSDAAARIFHVSEKPRVSIWVSKQMHCLHDLILRQDSGELDFEIAHVVSNHRLAEPICAMHDLPFHYVDFKEGKEAVEARQKQILSDEPVELVVLAKYMQVLTGGLLEMLPPTINIHHSFLPAFPGADPYRQAFSRGVKIIGATAHYVTEELDAGPIIDQEVRTISHRDSLTDLRRKGALIERETLLRAVAAHCEHRVICHGHKTYVFQD